MITEPASAGPELLIVAGVALGQRLAALADGLGLSPVRLELSAVARAAAERPALLIAIELSDPCDWPQLERSLLELGRADARVPVTVLGPAASEQLARQALSLGVAAYDEQPLGDEELLLSLRRALALASAAPPAAPSSSGVALQRLLGDSKALTRVKDLIQRTATGNATLLVRGESGTGKGVAARAIHELSARRDGPFMQVHCAALPDTLLESELFGYERGAFTGALARKPGRVELARGGTLFLDEIGDITLAIQVKLLRLLQDREYERLGGREALKADVRFVAATHRDLDAMVKSGAFREDLYYRLNVVTLWLPPLRARRDDIVALARRFCQESGDTNAKPDIRLTDDAIAALRALRWPGNVRQLQNFVERLVVLSEAECITAEDVRRGQSDETALFSTQVSLRDESVSVSVLGAPPRPLEEEVRRAERAALLKALAHSRGNRSLAARILGISRATLYKKLAEHEIR